ILFSYVKIIHLNVSLVNITCVYLWLGSFLRKLIDAVTFGGYNSMKKEAVRVKRIREENFANLFSSV
ncbi:hypothetical protein LR003_03065, partial [candidate division NPL-UPA2 bacterium]|nr:hypothetical protein [candidate division NPL-UPA2 bacterium]